MEASSSLQQHRLQPHAGHALVGALVRLLAAGVRAFAAAWASLVEYQRRQRTRSELRGLSDHYLKDIGLDRAQIDRLIG